jgi:uncharacterized membrane protein
MAIISVGECLSFGWATFKKRPWLLIAAPFVAGIAAGIASGIIMGILGIIIKGGMVKLVSFIVSLAVNTLSTLGILSVYLKAHDDAGSVGFRDLWHPESYWKLLGTIVLMDMILLIGFVLLIVPGIILSVALGFSSLLVIDKGLVPIAALKESARLTRGHRWDLFVLAVAVVGLNLVGLLALVIGLFITAPVSTIAMVHAFRTLQKNAPATVG